MAQLSTRQKADDFVLNHVVNTNVSKQSESSVDRTGTEFERAHSRGEQRIEIVHVREIREATKSSKSHKPFGKDGLQNY